MRNKLGQFIKGHKVNLGRPSPIKGRKLSKKHRERISKNNAKFWLGKKRSKRTITKISNSKKGIRNSPKTEFKKGHKPWNYKRGIAKDYYGYILIRVKNKYIKRSRLTMEKYLKRPLKSKEIVHHIDGDVTNDNIKNLQLFPNTSAHLKLHHKLWANFLPRG